MSDFESGAFNRALPTLRSLKFNIVRAGWPSRGRESHRSVVAAIDWRVRLEARVAVWTAELAGWVREQALMVGFDLCGVAGLAGEQERLDGERFAAWVEAGRAGEMEYLKRRNEAGELLRSKVQAAMPWARSVVVCALNYNAGGVRSIDPANVGAGWIARYAWSGKEQGRGGRVQGPEDKDEGIVSGLGATDYHEELLARLKRIEAALVGRVGCETRCYVDTGPLVERSMAARAGIGWVGKNTCVINQGLGSWFLLAVIVTSLEMAEGLSVAEAADRCGSCTRCIEACPTDALVGAREMDASKCISYLTIEKKGVIAEELREAMGRQVFGCDICQDVCPWNRRAPVAVKEGSRARAELINPALEWLGSMDEKEFRRWFKGSPLERTRRKRVQRNVAIAMGNSGERKFLSKLEEWVKGEDEVLAEAAGWAVSRIEGRDASGE
jgi:epoxyqueuosine reductase